MADLTTYSPLFLALFANADGTGEFAGNGYARLSITNDGTVFSVGGGGERTSIVPLTTVMATSTGWGLIRSVGFYDLSTAGTRLAWVAVDPIAVGGTQGITFPAGALGYTSGGSGAITPAVPSLYNIPRSLYVYANRGVEAQSVPARSLYLYDNRGVEPQTTEARSLYLYENRGIEALVPLVRALYAYENTRDGEVFPWLMAIDPTEQYRNGQVGLLGDGFGELLEAAAGATITTSSVSGGNIGSNTVDRTASAWISTNTTTDAWIRFTFGAPKVIVAVVLEAHSAGPIWGAPTFRFDAGIDVVGASLGLLDPSLSSAEYPVGGGRVLYTLPSPRTTSWVEVRSTNNHVNNALRALREVWILEDLDEVAETSTVALGVDGMGIVQWANRSPGLWPANGGQPITPAAVVTVPPTGESGLVVVTEST